MSTIFSAYDIRGRIGESLTTETIWNVGKAFAEWLPEEGSVVLAKSANADDSIVHALTEGLLLQGRNVVDKGQGDQSVVLASIDDEKAAGGVYVAHDDLQNIEIATLFDNQTVAITAEKGLNEIAQLVESGNFVPAAEKGTLQ